MPALFEAAGRCATLSHYARHLAAGDLRSNGGGWKRSGFADPRARSAQSGVLRHPTVGLDGARDPLDQSRKWREIYVGRCVDSPGGPMH